MLAKQGWRLLTEANSLVSAVMRARYYSNRTVLTAELRNNPSYVWRGIFQALEAVRAGARKKIGNGKDTLVWNKAWLPDENNGFVSTVEHPIMAGTKVSSLMSVNDKSWDVEVLYVVLCTRDAELVQRIPIPMCDIMDSWYWILDAKGEFTVKSCYRWIQGECHNEYNTLWKQLWNLKLLEKVSNFLWRLCKGCLPTNAALVYRHVNIEACCPWCYNVLETDTHVMFLCTFAKTLWLTAGLAHLVYCSVSDTVCEIFTRVFNQGTKEQCVQTTMLCWSLWNRRNKWVWDRTNGSVFGVRNAANHLLRDWKEAQVKIEDRRIRGDMCARIWSPPKEGWLKINIDAAVFFDGGIGVAAIIRDDQARFIAARGKRVAGAWKPREAEAIGLKEALSWVIEKGYTTCVFETDAYVLADACNGKPGEAIFGTIVMDCIHMLKHINPVLVDFVYRSTNSAAHVLAQAVYSMLDVGEWSVTPPDFLKHVLNLAVHKLLAILDSNGSAE